MDDFHAIIDKLTPVSGNWLTTPNLVAQLRKCQCNHTLDIQRIKHIIRALLPQIYLGLRGIVILNLGLQLCNIIVICHVELLEIAKLAI